MDFTMLPSERELAELRALLIGVEGVREPSPGRRTALITRIGRRSFSRIDHGLNGERPMSKGQIRVTSAGTSSFGS